MMNTKHAFIVLLGFAVVIGTAPAAQTKRSTEKTTGTAEKVEVGTTLQNLQAAFMGESSASARYAAYAKKADEEGYKQVANMFRAAARSETIHAANHAAVIKKLGGEPGVINGKHWELKAPEVKSTRENLEAAIKGEKYESTSMYPAFIKKARADKNAAAVRSFNYANQVEKNHAKLYRTALDNLDAWKDAGQKFWVCQVCGNIVEKVDFKYCPVCNEPRKEYKQM
ncbi:rubrerythrin family protein [bacterium]|nr:rubrerythrin family protein [bacterium]